MCGIAGFIDFNKKSSYKDLKNMTDVLYHRGPDDSGYSFYSLSGCNIGLGHRRLSILDLSSHGHQPMKFDNLEVIYNGEVYNFKEIRVELEKYGYSFESNSDTEVILKAYHKWGIKSVHKFNGMFAIAIYDKQKKDLILIRDRAGVKPLYYYYDNGLFMFASELKSFHEVEDFKKSKVINKSSLKEYLQYGYILAPKSIFKNTYKLMQGHYLKLNINNSEFKIKKYWDIVDIYNKPKLNVSFQEAKEHTHDLLKTACNYRMVSDVPVGVFLSGGYDSAGVTAILQKNMTQKLKTFSIGFEEEKYNEAHHAKSIASYLGTDHTEYYCTQKDALEIIPTLSDIYDEPFADNSTISTILVSKLAKKDVTVSLSADGGDELFGGYNKYLQSIKFYEKMNKIPNIAKKVLFKILNSINPYKIPYFKNKQYFALRYDKLKNYLKFNNVNDFMKYYQYFIQPEYINEILLDNHIEFSNNFNLFEEISDINDSINKMLAVDYTTYMVDDILTKVDRATMSVSLEGREPLLDFNLIEYVARLPSEYKINNGDTKYIFKNIVHDYIPKDMMDRPKMGFSVPITEWFRDELKDIMLDYLNEDFLKEQKLFNVHNIIKMRDDYFNGRIEYANRLWMILVFQMWYKRWM